MVCENTTFNYEHCIVTRHDETDSEASEACASLEQGSEPASEQSEVDYYALLTPEMIEAANLTPTQTFCLMTGTINELKQNVTDLNTDDAAKKNLQKGLDILMTALNKHSQIFGIDNVQESPQENVQCSNQLNEEPINNEPVTQVHKPNGLATKTNKKNQTFCGSENNKIIAKTKTQLNNTLIGVPGEVRKSQRIKDNEGKEPLHLNQVAYIEKKIRDALGDSQPITNKQNELGTKCNEKRQTLGENGSTAEPQQLSEEPNEETVPKQNESHTKNNKKRQTFSGNENNRTIAKTNAQISKTLIGVPGERRRSQRIKDNEGKEPLHVLDGITYIQKKIREVLGDSHLEPEKPKRPVKRKTQSLAGTRAKKAKISESCTNKTFGGPGNAKIATRQTKSLNVFERTWPVSSSTSINSSNTSRTRKLYSPSSWLQSLSSNFL
nr:PREDICTED: uncharacterized protein LOC103313614 isoform X2 [Tribolium castaneum]|eukprot:XP_008195543.1 PREDICTED: uncharacterized protein LOC103313614 isoform X2 [Tribolium castaneum]